MVNKMDSVQPAPYGADRFYQIEQQMRALLCGEMQFAERHVRAVPVSGITGQNLASLEDSCPLRSWYSGPTLLQALDAFVVPPRRLDRAFRGVVCAAPQQDPGRGRCEVDVSVLQGKVAVGRTVGFYRKLSAISSNEGEHHPEESIAAAGDTVKAAGDAPNAPASSGTNVHAHTHDQSAPVIVTVSSISKPNVGTAGSSTGYHATGGEILTAGERGTIVLFSK